MPNKRSATIGHVHAPETSAAITDANSKATDIFISGATGTNARFINGHYKPTQQTGPDGHVIYHKHDGGDSIDEPVRIEHVSHTEGVWQLKHLSDVGTDVCYAGVQGGCALEACTSRVWRVAESREWHEQSSLKMLTGGEAKRAVSNLNLQLNMNPR
jgi:hypothetical protein